MIYGDNDGSKLCDGCGALGAMHGVGGGVCQQQCHKHSRYCLKDLKQAILGFKGLDIRSISMLYRPYFTASAADRSCGTTSFSCVPLASSLSYVLTGALTILLLQIDISLEGSCMLQTTFRSSMTNDPLEAQLCACIFPCNPMGQSYLWWSTWSVLS